MRFVTWVIETITFYLKAALFLGVLALLFIYGTVHALIFGGPIMTDDAWFLYKILLFLLAPIALAFIIAGRRDMGPFLAALFGGWAISILLACSPLVSWGNYTHAPSFREAAKLYSIENGKLAIPEKNRLELLRDCGSISHEGMQDTCKTIVYCQEYDALGYERMGCEELLTKKTSPAILDLAVQEWRSYEYDQR
ncbi:MAG: hypothetical protein ACRD72_00735 [Candidatus Angelobacter sp.]